MGYYFPFNYDQINVTAGSYNPSPVKRYNNYSFAFWERALFQRALSVLKINLPDDWNGSIKDFFNYCLYRFGFVAVFDYEDFGTIFQPAQLSGYDIWYRPTEALIANPAFTKDTSLKLKIGEECQILKLTPDFLGCWDIISYYAAKLSELDCAIDISLINNKYAFLLSAKDKASAQTLKKMLDLVNKGEPAVVTDVKMHGENYDGDTPWNIWDKGNLRESYLTTDQLADFRTILHNFDTEIGIKTLPIEKKERMIQDEATSIGRDAISRATVWLNTFNESAIEVNNMFNLNIKAEWAEEEADNEQLQIDIDRTV